MNQNEKAEMTTFHFRVKVAWVLGHVLSPLRHPRTHAHTHKNAFQSGNFEVTVLVFLCGQLKTELFENDDVLKSNFTTIVF